MKALALFLAVLTALASRPATADPEDNWNVRVGALGLLARVLSVGVDYKLSERLALGPAVGVWRRELDDFGGRAAELRVHGEYFFGSAYAEGAVLDFSAGFLGIKAKRHPTAATTEEAEFSAFVAEALGGYHWFFGDSFNFELGAGLRMNTIGHVDLHDEHGGRVGDRYFAPVGLALKGDVGWTF